MWEVMQSKFYLTVVYGARGMYARRQLQSTINEMPHDIQSDWLLNGDFNEIRFPKEHQRHGQFDLTRAT